MGLGAVPEEEEGEGTRAGTEAQQEELSANKRW